MEALKEIAHALKESVASLEHLQNKILQNLASLTPTQVIEYASAQRAQKETIETLQRIAFKVATEETIKQVVTTGKLVYGNSHYENITISSDTLFGKPYVSSETWYTNAKLRALYPNKYPTNV